MGGNNENVVRTIIYVSQHLFVGNSDITACNAVMDKQYLI